MLTYFITFLHKEYLPSILTYMVIILCNLLFVLTESELWNNRGLIDIGWLFLDPGLLSVHAMSLPAPLVGVPRLLLLLRVYHVHGLHERGQTVLFPQFFALGVLGAVEVPIIDSFRFDVILWVLLTLYPVELTTLVDHKVLHDINLLAPFARRIVRL
jgi:hypothetical protein